MAARALTSRMIQIPLPIFAAPEPTFDNFVPGANAAALAHLRALVPPAAPVYLWGPAGSGKTELLQALAGRAAGAGLRAQGFDAETPLPWTLADDTALVLLDDADAWSPAQQHAAFTLFVDAASRVAEAGAGRLGLQFASAGRLPPVDLPLREDLRTRLGWGPVHALKPLAEADTRAALRQEAQRRGLALGDDVLDHLLTRFARDLKSLMALLHRLDGFALAEKRGLTVPLLKKMLDEERAPG